MRAVDDRINRQGEYGVIITVIEFRKEGRKRLKTFVFKNKDENARLNNIRTVKCCTVKMTFKLNKKSLKKRTALGSMTGQDMLGFPRIKAHSKNKI